jgi:Fe-S-cluster containining protein
MKKTRLSAKRKSQLCLQCGKCCMSMTFFGGEVDDEARDEIRWIELHGLKIDYVASNGALEYYFTIPRRCDMLQERAGPNGSHEYVCSIYDTRPQMCRDYDGSVDGPLGVADCLWKLEARDSSRLVQLQRPSRGQPAVH